MAIIAVGPNSGLLPEDLADEVRFESSLIYGSGRVAKGYSMTRGGRIRQYPGTRVVSLDERIAQNQARVVDFEDGGEDEIETQISQILASVTDTQGRVLILHHIEGLTVDQIAVNLEMKVRKVRHTLKRACDNARKALAAKPMARTATA